MGKKIEYLNIEKKINEILAEKAEFPVEEIKLTSSLTDDLGIDSFGAIELMFSLKDEFGIEVAKEEINGLKTVQDVIDKVNEKCKRAETENI